ncbi:DUF3035 domain-containing protein [Tropicimonas marinistellae]|uniref:DUF3035 domain-containing protein n=1 Tax=Tropicimonas marinistellae TaxID=1739787 RepID=UPI000834B0D6|nr:DUF3035 domain-containing protein [Tropicimonas marinistellae]
MRVTGMIRAGAALALVFVVTACGSRDPRIMHIERGKVTPDEFAILPTKPIEMPQSYGALPAPTPGGLNRTDATPREDAVAALGGSPARMRPDGTLTGDAALIRQSTRYGIQPNIRAELAAEDFAFRKRNNGRPLERLFRVPTYYRAYSDQELNQHATLQQWRRAGYPTPAAPPSGTDE